MNDPSTPSSDRESFHDLTGRQLGDYLVLRRLGRGGMSEVFLAKQVSLRRKVALKVLKPQLAKDESYLRRFHKEAQAAASLVHANIVQIHDVGCIDDVHFISQEYVEGQNLRQLLGKQQALSVSVAANILRQVAAALHKAASHGITHRDVKPENIMLSRLGEVKVADFGLARLHGDEEGVETTQVGITMGTPLYMSPEQVEGKQIDPRSDIYSLGVTCYQMVAGRPPFEGENALSVAVQHLKVEPTPLAEVRPDLPQAYCDLVHKMLAKDPADRYQRASDILQDVRQLQIPDDPEWAAEVGDWSTAELLALADARLEATQQLDGLMKARSRDSRRSWLLAGSVLLCAVLAGCLAWMNRGEFLLEIAEDEVPKVDRMGTVQQQYIYASVRNTEDAWESVEEFFPPRENAENQRYAWLSRQHRAELYLQSDRLPEAMELYDELAELVTEVEFRAFGLAGQANVHMRLGQKPRAAAKLAQVAPLFEKLGPSLRRELVQRLDPELRSQFQRSRRENPESSGRRS